MGSSWGVKKRWRSASQKRWNFMERGRRGGEGESQGIAGPKGALCKWPVGAKSQSPWWEPVVSPELQLREQGEGSRREATAGLWAGKEHDPSHGLKASPPRFCWVDRRGLAEWGLLQQCRKRKMAAVIAEGAVEQNRIKSSDIELHKWRQLIFAKGQRQLREKICCLLNKWFWSK